MAISLRRPLALASVVTATLAGAVVLRSLTGGGGDAPPARTPDPSPVATTAGVSTTPPPVAREVSAVLEKRVFAAGEAVTLSHGIGFLSAADGSLETWSFPAGSSSFYPLDASPDGAALTFSDGKEGSATLVIDRATGKTWQLPEGASAVHGAGHGPTVLVSFPANGRREFAVFNVIDGTFRMTGIAEKQPGQAFTAPDGRKAAITSDGRLYLIDLASGQAQVAASGLNPERDSAEVLPGALGIALSRAGSSNREWYGWDGASVPGGLAVGAISPNGKYLAVEWTPGPIKAVGMGGYPAVEALLISDRQPNTLVSQLLSANLAVLSASPWTSASDALVVEVANGYRLLSPAGQVIATIEDPIHVLAPIPSPTIAGLLGTNRGTIVNTARNQTIAPRYAELPWRAHWTTKPGELLVELSTPGKGRSWIEAVLPFEARPGAVHVPPAAVVRAGGDCLNLREKPDSKAPSLKCMPDGTVADFQPAADPAPDPKTEGSGEPTTQYAGFEDANLVVWLHLKLPDGTTGWADSKFLGWAK